MNDIIQGDALAVLRGLESESVNCVITSPPYWGLRDYKVDGQLGLEKTYQEYLDKLMAIFNEVKRVLRQDGCCFVNIGDSYSGSGKGDNHDGRKEVVPDGQYGHMRCNNIPSKSLIGIPERFVIAMTDAGWVRRNTLIWWKRNCMPSSARDRFTVDFEPVYFFCKSGKYWFERQFEAHSRDWTDCGGSLSTDRHDKAHINGTNRHKRPFPVPNPLGRNTRCVWDIPTAPFKDAHFATFPEKLVEPMIRAGCPKYVCDKCGKAREKIMEPSEEYKKILDSIPKGDWYPRVSGSESFEMSGAKSGNRFSGSAEYITTGLTDCGCSAPFRPGIVLDPFAGAGTVGVVAKKLERSFIGIELNPEYINMAQSRIAAVKVQGKLFNQ